MIHPRRTLDPSNSSARRRVHLAAAVALLASPQTNVHIGDVAVGRLPDAAVHELSSPREQLAVVSVGSLDFDPSVCLESTEGQVLARDDDGGPGDDARLEVRLEAGVSYRVRVLAGAGSASSGSFVLMVADSAGSPPTSDVWLEYHQAAARQAERDGDLATAAAHAATALACDGDSSTGRDQEWRHVLDLAERAGDDAWIIHAHQQLARAAEWADDLEASAVHHRAALHAARRMGDLAVEANELVFWANAQLVLSDTADFETELKESERRASASGDVALACRVDLLRGQLCHLSFDLPGARASYRRARDRAGEAGDRLRWAEATLRLGMVAQLAEEYQLGIDLARECLAAIPGDGPVGLRVEAGLVVAKGLQYLGQIDGAIAELREVQRSARTAHDAITACVVAGDLGDLLLQRGDRDEARRAFEQQLALATGESAWVVPQVLVRLAGIDEDERRYEEARARLEDALAAGVATADPVTELDAAVGLSRVCLLSGDLDVAMSHARSAIDRAVESGLPSFEVEARLHFGDAHRRLGELADARAEFQRALDQSRELGLALREGEALRRLAETHALLGDDRAAIDAIGQAEQLAEQRGDARESSRLAVERAAIDLESGDARRALADLEELAARSRDDSSLRRRALVLLSRAHVALGDPASAAHHAGEALVLADAVGDPADVLTALVARVAAMAAGGEADPRLAEALQLAERLGREVEQLHLLDSVARVALARRERDAAGYALAQATAVLDRCLVRGLGIAERVGLRGRFHSFAAHSHDLAELRRRAVPDAAHPADRAARVEVDFIAAERWRARGLLEGVIEHRRGERSKDVIAARRQVAESLARRDAILTRLSAAVRADDPPERVARLREAADRALAAADEARRAARSLPSQASAAVDHDLISLVPLRSRWLTDRLLIEYVEGHDRLYAYAISVDDAEYFDLGPLDEVRSDVDHFVAMISDPRRLGSVEDVRAVGSRLYRRLLAAPLAMSEGSPGGLIVVPSSSLSSLPFDALVVDAPSLGVSGGFEVVPFVIDAYAVTYVPSAALLVEAGSERASRVGVGGRRGLILGDPIYDGSGHAAEPLARLPHSRAEAVLVAGLLAGSDRIGVDAASRSSQLHHPRFDLFLGEDASSAPLRSDLADYDVLHLAAHGSTSRESAERCALYFSATDQRDGVVSTSDVYELDLAAELVVLSACSTATGRPLRGEGVESLARAFLYAGARNVIATLWEVSDQAAARIVEEFYRAWLAGAPPSVALRDARRAQRDEAVSALSVARGVGRMTTLRERLASRGHPFYWASFIAVGPP